MSNYLKKVLNNRVPVAVVAVAIAWLSLTTIFAFTNNQAVAASTEEFKFIIHYYYDPEMTQECGYYNECTFTYVGDCPPEPNDLYILREPIYCEAQ